MADDRNCRRNGWPKVFGIGLNKTGTTTLAACLKILGYDRQCGYSHDLLEQYRSGNLELIFATLDAHDSFEDWPYPLMYREIFARYGKTARYVLTKRSSADKWLSSLKRHSLRTDPDRYSRQLVYGYHYPHGFEAEHIAIYTSPNEGVVDFFQERTASDVLLEICWEQGDGWQELCQFLKLPVPACPFPHENSGMLPIPTFREAENRRRIDQQMRSR
jgi:hypothetical protein